MAHDSDKDKDKDKDKDPNALPRTIYFSQTTAQACLPSKGRSP
jgi:hypothetical protein